MEPRQRGRPSRLERAWRRRLRHWFTIGSAVVAALSASLPPIGATHSDLDTWLAWLLKAVRPTVQKCLLHVPRETVEDILFGPSVLEKAGYTSPISPLGETPIPYLENKE
jgi:hypothetical protein